MFKFRRSIMAVAVSVMVLSTGVASTATAASGKVKADYGASWGLRMESPQARTKIEVPVGAVGEDAVFSYEEIAPQAERVRIAHAFRMLASASRDGRSLTRFSKNLRLEHHYTDAELAASKMPATSMQFFYQGPDGAWIPVPSTVDTNARIIRAEVDHFTDYGVGSTGADDAFARADGVGLGTSVSGQNWATDGTPWGICGGAACLVSGASANEDNYARIDANVTHQKITAVVASRSTSATGLAGVVASVTNDWNTNMVWVGLSAAGAVEMWTLTGGGTWSTGAIASASTAYDASAARTLEVRTQGTNASVFIDTVQVLGPVTVPTPPADGVQAGMFVGTYDADPNNWPRFESFTVVANE